ncbi:hypothetical protein QFZ66_002066 [Streptomyces sp. B4I13]|nr:hypothetical protein [Streptomyces sp. B4I13]
MARALIAGEARLYQEAQVDPRIPWRQWTVVERREETPDAVSFLLSPADEDPVPPARAGQYVSVRVQMPDGIYQLRQYSLSGAPGDRLRRITVKRGASVADAPEGEVSNQLRRTVRAGDELALSAPFGDVVLDDAPLAARRAPSLLEGDPVPRKVAGQGPGANRGGVRPAHYLAVPERSPADGWLVSPW